MKNIQLNNPFAIYAKNKKGSFDEIVVNISKSEYDYTGNVDKKELLISKDNKAAEFLVSRQFLKNFMRFLDFQNYSGSFYTNPESYAKRKKEERQFALSKAKRPIIKKEKVWQLINQEISEKELSNIYLDKFQFENDDYCDFDKIIEKVYDFMNDKITVNYFTNWCVVLTKCFYTMAQKSKDKNLKELFEDIGYYFDGVSFMDTNISPKKRKTECREIIAFSKYYKHKVNDNKNDRKTDFLTNDVVIYVTFERCADMLYRVCIIDKLRKKANYTAVANIDYNEKINYTFVTKFEFDSLIKTYSGEYKFDPTMTIDYPLIKK